MVWNQRIKKRIKFDAIKKMREIREKISMEIMNMTYEEEREYLDKLPGNRKTDFK